MKTRLPFEIAVSETDELWAKTASQRIISEISRFLSVQGHCSVMLTGGRSAEQIYKIWAGERCFCTDKLSFFFGDERCVPPDNAESNFALSAKIFLHRLTDECGVRIHRMKADSSNSDAALSDYEEGLPQKIDVLLLGIGEDGHIASLFPYGDWQNDQGKVKFVSGPKPPADRMTILPKVVTQAGSIFILGRGKEKGEILHMAACDPDNIPRYPVLLAKGAQVIVDPEAWGVLKDK